MQQSQKQTKTKEKQQIQPKPQSQKSKITKSSRTEEDSKHNDVDKKQVNPKQTDQRSLKKDEIPAKQQQNSKLRQKVPSDKLSQRRENSQKSNTRGERQKPKVKQEESEDEEMEDESEQIEQQSESSEESKRQKSLKKANAKTQAKPEEKVAANGFDIRSLIKSESQMDSKYRLKFTGFKDSKPSNQMCQICFQVLNYPLLLKKEGDEESEDISYDEDALTNPQKNAKLLYSLVYCSDCSVPVHLNCLGQGFDLYEIIKGTYKYIIFKCERCSLKQKDRTLNTKCHACHIDEGFIKAIKLDEGDSQEYLFMHQICAMSFKDYFILKDPITFELKVGNQKSILQDDWVQKKRTCHFCHGSGKLLECSIKDCDKFAHPYCIMNVLKDYYYYQSIQDELEESKFNERWMYQLYFTEEQSEIIFQVLCKEHYNQNAYYCYCDKQAVDSDMVICEYCFVWYHQSCTQPFEKESKYRCKKCEQWVQKIQDPLLDLLLKRKSYNELTNEDNTTWSFDSLFFADQEVNNSESKIFEQILFTKAWFIMSQYLIENIASEIIIDEHLKTGKKLFLQCEDMERDLRLRLKQSKQAVNSVITDLKKKGELDFKEELDQNLKLIPDNVKQNKILVEKLDKQYKDFINDQKFINDDVIELKSSKERYEVLKKANLVCQVQKQKPQPDDVSEIIEGLKEWRLTNHKCYHHLSQIIEEYETWEENCTEKLKNNMILDEKIENKFEQMKNQKRGVELQEKRFNYLKDVFEKKQTCQEGLKLIEDGQKLRVDISDEIQEMKSTISRIEKAEKEIMKFEKSNSKPVQNVLTGLKVLACMPLKSKNIETILQKWYISSIWNTKASYFIKDKKYENLQLWAEEIQQSQQDSSSMDIDEGDRTRPSQKNYLWTLERAQQLLVEADQKKIYFDQQLFHHVKEKILIVERLKKSLKVIKQDKHDEKTINSYLKELKLIENIDFSKEINQTQQKLKLIAEVNQAVTNDYKNKQNIEMLEDLNK